MVPGQAAVTERREREERYLTRLIIDPTYRRWNTRYVTLAGGYRPPPQIDPAYRQVLVRGDGPNARSSAVRSRTSRRP